MIKILYEDNHLIAVNKPAGILVQAGDRKSSNLMDEIKKYLKEKYKKEGNVFLGLVHRLDRPVSGIVIFAKTSKGASRLSEQFRGREVKKIYTAIVEGKVSKAGELIHYLKKDPDTLKAVISEEERSDYQRAELSYEASLITNNYSLITIYLKTGRFNQIRAQFSHIGHPIVGDVKYGAKKLVGSLALSLSNGIALCATEISFKTTTSEKDVNLKIEYPDSWRKLLD